MTAPLADARSGKLARRWSGAAARPSRLISRVATMLFALAAGGIAAANETPIVAAAASIKLALDGIVAEFSTARDTPVRLAYGSSGNIARQIRQGAPFDLFLSADETYVLSLAEEGLIPDRGRVYASGRIAVYVPTGSPVDGPSLDAIAAALDSGALGRVAIPNPEHAPYGRAAREALQSARLWQRLQTYLVRGENAGQAARFAVSGSADAAVLPYSLLSAPRFADGGSFALVAESAHRPLRHRMALISTTDAASLALFEYLQSEPARALLVRHGLAPPTESK